MTQATPMVRSREMTRPRQTALAAWLRPLAQAALVALALLAAGWPAAAQDAAQATPPAAQAAAAPQADAPAATGVTEVRVLPLVEVPGSEFTLGEVAEFDGPKAMVERLAGISLGRSPLPGRSLRLNEPYLRARLNGLPADAVVLTVPADAQVLRASQTITGKEIGSKVLALAAEQAAASGGDLEQKLATPIADAVLPMGPVDWKIEPLGRHLSAGGSRTFRVVASVQGDEVYRALTRVDQQLFSNVVIARKPVRRNDVIRAGDVSVERKPISGLKSESYLTRIAQVVGARAKRPIGPGEWITKTMVVAVADVPEGGPVQLVYQTESVLFTSPGVALVPAKLGAFIPVRNLESGKIVYGVVQSRNTVKVN